MKNTHASYATRMVIQDILEWIEFNISKPLSLYTLVEKSGYSMGYFQKCFREISGMSPATYVRYRRMVIAKDLLTETNSTIDEISMYLGYHRQSTFCRTFREYYHLTPVQYRKKTSIEAI